MRIIITENQYGRLFEQKEIPCVPTADTKYYEVDVTIYDIMNNGAILHYGHAIEYQDNLNYTEPPDWSQSMRLYLGAALLEANRPEEAEEVYRKDLQWNQRNGWTTFGLGQALGAQGKEQEAIIVNRQFEGLWRNADVELDRSRL